MAFRQWWQNPGAEVSRRFTTLERVLPPFELVALRYTHAPQRRSISIALFQGLSRLSQQRCERA